MANVSTDLYGFITAPLTGQCKISWMRASVALLTSPKHTLCCAVIGTALGGGRVVNCWTNWMNCPFQTLFLFGRTFSECAAWSSTLIASIRDSSQPLDQLLVKWAKRHDYGDYKKKYYQCQLHFDLWNRNKVARSWNLEALRILPERNTTSGHFGWKGNTNCIEQLIRRGVCWLWRSLWTRRGKTALDKVLGLQLWVGSSGLVSIWRTSGGVFKPKSQHTPLEELDHSLLFKVKIHLNVQNYKTRSMLQCVYVIWISVVFFVGYYFCFIWLGQMHTDHTWTVAFHHISCLGKKLIWTFQLQCSIKCRTKVARHFWVLWHGWFKTKIIIMIIAIIVSNNNKTLRKQKRKK